jgi:hypothetical protein
MIIKELDERNVFIHRTFSARALTAAHRPPALAVVSVPPCAPPPPPPPPPWHCNALLTRGRSAAHPRPSLPARVPRSTVNSIRTKMEQMQTDNHYER